MSYKMIVVSLQSSKPQKQNPGKSEGLGWEDLSESNYFNALEYFRNSLAKIVTSDLSKH